MFRRCVRLSHPEVKRENNVTFSRNAVLKMEKNAISLTWGKFSARELQHADFSRESHLSHHLDHPRKPILTNFGRCLPSGMGASQVAAIGGQNAKQPRTRDVDPGILIPGSRDCVSPEYRDWDIRDPEIPTGKNNKLYS